MAKTDDSLSEGEARWAMEIGRFVIAFGSIEALTYLMLRQLPRDPIAQPLIDANLSLKSRLELLISIAYHQSEDEWHKAAQLLEQVLKLSGKRNLIAHSGVSFQLSFGANGEMDFEEVIQERKSGKRKQKIAFDELVKHRREVEEIDRQLLSALGELLDND